jgi:hypothetical protein
MTTVFFLLLLIQAQVLMGQHKLLSVLVPDGTSSCASSGIFAPVPSSNETCQVVFVVYQALGVKIDCETGFVQVFDDLVCSNLLDTLPLGNCETTSIGFECIDDPPQVLAVDFFSDGLNNCTASASDFQLLLGLDVCVLGDQVFSIQNSTHLKGAFFDTGCVNPTGEVDFYDADKCYGDAKFGLFSPGPTVSPVSPTPPTTNTPSTVPTMTTAAPTMTTAAPTMTTEAPTTTTEAPTTATETPTTTTEAPTTTMPSTAPTFDRCNTVSPKIKYKKCISKIKRCKNSNMRWVGRGCRDGNKELIYDGGCQCAGYCGFGCKQA